jgi:hypothetical protein
MSHEGDSQELQAMRCGKCATLTSCIEALLAQTSHDHNIRAKVESKQIASTIELEVLRATSFYENEHLRRSADRLRTRCENMEDKIASLLAEDERKNRLIEFLLGSNPQKAADLQCASTLTELQNRVDM